MNSYTVIKQFIDGGTRTTVTTSDILYKWDNSETISIAVNPGPSPDPETNYVAGIELSSGLYSWVGSANSLEYLALASDAVSGEPSGGGSQGAQGPVGPQGTTGSQGAAGPQGATGSAGAAGAQGFQGPIGNQGPVGVQGSTGSTGSQGPVGSQGVVGSQGPTGTPSNLILKSSFTTVSNSATLSISSLDINTDGEYRLIVDYKPNASATGEEIYLYINGDTTLTHYNQEGLQIPWYVWGAQNKPWIGVLAPEQGFLDITIKRTTSGWVTARGLQLTGWASGGSPFYGCETYVRKTDAVAANVTSMSIVANVANGFLTGTKWWLYKLTRS